MWKQRRIFATENYNFKSVRLRIYSTSQTLPFLRVSVTHEFFDIELFLREKVDGISFCFATRCKSPHRSYPIRSARKIRDSKRNLGDHYRDYHDTDGRPTSEFTIMISLRHAVGFSDIWGGGGGGYESARNPEHGGSRDV